MHRSTKFEVESIFADQCPSDCLRGKGPWSKGRQVWAPGGFSMPFYLFTISSQFLLLRKVSVWVQRGAVAQSHGYLWEKEARETEERQWEALLGSITFHGIMRISKNCKSELAALLYCHPAWTFKLTICCEFFFHFFFLLHSGTMHSLP